MLIWLTFKECFRDHVTAAQRCDACRPDRAPAVAPQEFDELVAKLKEVQALSGISGLLGWDEMVMMPPAAAASRGAQKAALAGVLHERTTDPEIGRLLEKLDGVAFEDPYRTAAVREAKHDYQKATRITSSLAKREAEHETEAYQVRWLMWGDGRNSFRPWSRPESTNIQGPPKPVPLPTPSVAQAWIKAREAKSFEPFSRALGKWVRLRRERASLIDPGQNAYDVLLDEFQPGLTSARLDEIFGRVKAGLVPLLARVRAHGTAPDDAWLNGGPFDREAQAALCRQLSLDLGFDLDSGRLDVSVHPFTGGAHPTDVRMTTRFKDDQLLDGIAGTIHETGHALYEQGRNLDYDGLPVNEVRAGGFLRKRRKIGGAQSVASGRGLPLFTMQKGSPTPRPSTSRVSVLTFWMLVSFLCSSVTTLPHPSSSLLGPRLPAWRCTSRRACSGSGWSARAGRLPSSCCQSCKRRSPRSVQGG